MQKELNNFMGNEVWSLVERPYFIAHEVV
jgi:hypothetical protein